MIRLLVIGLLLASCPTSAQSWVDLAVGAGLKVTSGFHRGRADAALFHYDAVARVHPWYDDPRNSWVNKWALDPSGQPIVGQERFWGSARWFVAWTDHWHRDNMIRIQSNNASIIYMSWAADTTRPGRNWYEQLAGRHLAKKPWWAYAFEYVLLSGADAAGFYLSYNHIYQP